MILSSDLPEWIRYRSRVPADTSFSTHDNTYLERVNQEGGKNILLDAIGEESRCWLDNNILLSRNKAPHGLGGLLLWYFGKKNFLDMNFSERKIFCGYLLKIERELRQIYGQMYYILIGMCLSKSPGIGKRQSVAFAHAHFSLIPRKDPPHEESGVKFEILQEKKRIQWTKIKIKKRLRDELDDFWKITLHHEQSSILVVSNKTGDQLQIPDWVIWKLGTAEKNAILQAKNQDQQEVWSTLSMMLNDEMRTRIGVSLGTPGYLHVDGIELSREPADRERWSQFETFSKNCFEKIQQTLKST